MCDHRLHDGPLVCTRDDPHEPSHGCTYAATVGPDLDNDATGRKKPK